MARNPLFYSLLGAFNREVALSDQRAGASGFKSSRRQFIKSSAVLLGSAASLPGLSWALAGGINKKHASSLNIAVVGAGLAGLSCTYELSKRGVIASVFEATERSGGRCYSMGPGFPGAVNFGAQTIELGGEFINTTHTAMRGYANEFGLTLENLVKEPGEVAYYFNGQHYDEAEVVADFRAFVDAMRDDLRTLGAPTANSHTASDRVLDLTPLDEYLNTRGASPLLKKIIDVIYTNEYGLEISQQSALNFLLFMHADRRSRFKPFGVFSDERFHIVEGNQSVAQGLEARLAQPINYQHKLVKLSRLSDGRVELVFDQAGQSITKRFDAVVLTIPFSVLRDVELDVSLDLPAWKHTAINELRYGTTSKTMIAFNSRHWQAYGSNGTSYSDLTHHQATWETNPALATAQEAVLTDYSGGLRGATRDPNNPQGEAQRFLEALDFIYPGAGAAAKRDGNYQLTVHLENWLSNPYAKGSYVCNHPGYFTTIADNEATTIGNIFFAGEHTSSFYEWQGFMEGAVLSGQRTAKEILTASGNSLLW